MLGSAIAAQHGRWGLIPHITVGLLTFLLANVYMSPDIDLWNSRATKVWGCLRFVWAPLSWAVKHRSRKSHSILVGTLIRLAYLLNLVWIVTTAAIYLVAGTLTAFAGFGIALAIFMFTIISLRVSDASLVILVAINTLPLLILTIHVPAVTPWLASCFCGFIAGDVFHLLHDKLDSIYRDRPKKDGKRQGWYW